MKLEVNFTNVQTVTSFSAKDVERKFLDLEGGFPLFEDAPNFGCSDLRRERDGGSSDIMESNRPRESKQN
jgi:hypothetical protein